MKKVLFATTALVASAGIASADVAVTGSAEMGVAVLTNGGDLEFFQDVDVTFTMSGETDNGLMFGAAVDLDEAQDTCTVTALPTTCTNAALDNTSDDGGVAIYIKGDFGTLTMGDTDGAMDWALAEGNSYNNPGSIADNETGHAGYAGSYLDGGSDGQIVRYDHSVGDFSFAVSVEQDANGAGSNTGFAVGVKGSFNNINVGVGYQDAAGSNANLAGISLGFSMDAFAAGIMYASGENAAGANDEIIQIGAGYSANGLSIHANWQQRETAGVSTDGWGMAMGYDLGGGATVKAGVNSDDEYSLGIAMSF